MELIGRALPALLAAALCGCTAHVSESALIRPLPGGPLTEGAVAAAAPVYSLSEHSIPAADGATLYAVHLSRPGARATVLYFGGNGYTIGQYGAWTAGVFAPLNVDVMIVDHRGYGGSTGTPTIAAMEGDALAAFDYLRRIEGPDRRIVAHGHSLGSFMAGHLAAHRPLAGVVLESSATTAEQWSDANIPGLARPFVTVRIDENLQGRGNLANMPQIEEPLLLLVGSRDRTTPPRLSEALYAASPLTADRKTLAVIAGANHTDVMTAPEAIAAYGAFLAARR